MTTNNTLRSIAFNGIIALLTACSPLQQAPLVYSSKTSVGLDISTPTNEQAGVNINIGYKLIDMAYVPVAVAKPCDKDNATDCTDRIYELEPIWGSSSDSNEKSEGNSSKNSSQDMDSKADQYTKSANTISELRAKEKILTQELENLKNEKDKNQQEAKNALEIAVDETKKLSGMPQDSEELESTASTLQTSTQKGESAVDAIPQIDTKIEKATSALLDVQKQISSKIANANRDSYSVFGSFDSNTKTKADGSKATAEADLNLGKVFSTGIAAQNLTDGLGKQFANSAVTASACLLSAQQMIDYYKTNANASSEADKEKFGDFSRAVISVCSPSKNNTAQN